MVSSLVSVYLSPCLAGSVRLFDVCLHLSPVICLAVWLAIRLSPTLVHGCLLFGCLSSLVSQFGWWCPALWMSVFTCLRPCVSLFGWWHPALRMSVFTCLPPCVCHGSPDVFLHWSPFISLPIWLVVSGSLDVRLHLLSPKQKPAMTHMTTLQPLISNTCFGKDCLFASKVLPQIVSEVVQMQIGQNRLNSYLRTVWGNSDV